MSLVAGEGVACTACGCWEIRSRATSIGRLLGSRFRLHSRLCWQCPLTTGTLLFQPVVNEFRGSQLSRKSGAQAANLDVASSPVLSCGWSCWYFHSNRRGGPSLRHCWPDAGWVVGRILRRPVQGVATRRLTEPCLPCRVPPFSVVNARFQRAHLPRGVASLLAWLSPFSVKCCRDPLGSQLRRDRVRCLAHRQGQHQARDAADDHADANQRAYRPSRTRRPLHVNHQPQ